MNRTARTLIITAAMTGLVAGSVISMTGCSSDSGKSAASDTGMSKHDCKGMNSCKDQGGCNTGDMGCKVDGIESPEVCRVLQISENNLWMMLHRARMALRRCLEQNWFAKKM